MDNPASALRPKIRKSKPSWAWNWRWNLKARLSTDGRERQSHHNQTYASCNVPIEPMVQALFTSGQGLELSDNQASASTRNPAYRWGNPSRAGPEIGRKPNLLEWMKARLGTRDRLTFELTWIATSLLRPWTRNSLLPDRVDTIFSK